MSIRIEIVAKLVYRNMIMENFKKGLNWLLTIIDYML